MLGRFQGPEKGKEKGAKEKGDRPEKGYFQLAI